MNSHYIASVWFDSYKQCGEWRKRIIQLFILKMYVNIWRMGLSDTCVSRYLQIFK